MRSKYSLTRRRRSSPTRILLDESVPVRLGALLTGHVAITIQRQGWTSVKNGKLLALAASAGFDVLLTADKGMEYQQNLATLPVSILVVLAKSNRIEDLALAVRKIQSVLPGMQPRTLLKIAA